MGYMVKLRKVRVNVQQMVNMLCILKILTGIPVTLSPESGVNDSMNRLSWNGSAGLTQEAFDE